MDSHGNTAACYEYDPYGNAIDVSGSHASINPLRYRGYYYDNETGLYYLQSRYYDPQIGRFINADGYAATGQGILSNNMFAYCGNNPVNNIDESGTRYVAVKETGGGNGLAAEDVAPYTPNNSGTVSLGISGSVGIGPWSVGGQVSITFDSEGKAALQYGTSGGLAADAAPAGFGVSVTPFIMVTNAPSYLDLEGPGMQMGAATPVVVVDYNAMLDGDDPDRILYHGVSVGLGISVPNFHVAWGDTYTFSAIEFDYLNFMDNIQYYSAVR